MKPTFCGMVLFAVLLASSSAWSGDCPAPDEWFPNTPKPTNSKPDPDSDCDFYKWAFQTFLFVTQPEPGPDKRPRFLKYDTPGDLFGDVATPRFSKSIREVANSIKPLRLAPRVSKSATLQSLEEFIQAGSNGALIDQNGRVVYYGLHLNETFVEFVRKYDYTDMTKLANAPSDQEFPRGSLELKSSWRVVLPGEDTSTFFTTKATISLLKMNADGKVVIDPNQTRDETMALLGLHVVGVVDGHPEFIWATFEHDQNAPDLPMGVAHDADQAVDDAHNWTLYAKSTTAKGSNRKPGQTPLPPLRLVDAAKQTLEPKTSVFREFQFGGEDDPSEIVTLNASVKNKIGTVAPNLAVWRNYSFRGALWMNNPAYFREGFDFVKADELDPAKKILGGETKLSNTTMESYTQHTQSCFHCHDTRERQIGSVVFPAKRLSVSHVLVNAYVRSQQANDNK